MNILFINTSGKYCEVALCNQHGVLAHKVKEEAMQHSTLLHTMVNELLANKNLSLKTLDAIGILNGPGSYTGLRIGLAAAKGFCYALDIPLLLLNKLELACDYYQHLFPEKNSAACIQLAREGEYFFALKENNNLAIPANVYAKEEVNEFLQSHQPHSLIYMDDNHFEGIAQVPTFISVDNQFIAEQLANALNANKTDNIFTAEPFYLKRVHANKPKRIF